ncbi:hypothetical protein KAI68_01790, partial [bacterium]|nr:hypothetical protein [bacterium]
YDKYKDKKVEELSKEDKEILSNLSKLTVFLSKIDSKNFNWLMKTASCSYIYFPAAFFVEYLEERKDKGEGVKYIGKIFLKMLEGYTPEFRKEDIYSIVEFLYKSKDKKIKKEANEICNIYGKRGIDFLRKLWKKNNPDQTE